MLHLGLFALWTSGLGAQLANALALAVATIVNTFANGWFSFGKRDRAGWLRAQLQAGGVFLFGLVSTAGALALVDVVWSTAGTAVNVTVLAAANAAATLGRFIAMRSWIFRTQRDRPRWRPVSGAVAS